MKRNLSLPGLVMALVVAFGIGALPNGRALASGLAPEDAERLQRLNGLVEDLLASQASMQKRLSALADEIHSVREEGTKTGDRLNERFVPRDEFRKLAEAVRDLDRKREEDKRLILEEIRRLAHAPVVVPPRDPVKPPPRDVTPTTPGKGYTYIIKPGDTISAVVAAYRASGVNVTVDQVLKTNPNVKPTALAEGQEIFIPDPALK